MRKDEVYKIFFEDNERVADILNIYLDDSERISAGDIHEMNSGLIFKIREELAWRNVSKIRDIVRKVAFNTTFIIADIEPQDSVDYSYPLRELSYIYGEYEKQARSIRRSVRRQPKGLSRGEWLYSFKKENRLNPTVIILLYSGEEAWDGPTELWDMLDMEGVPKGLKSLVMNHKIHMIDVRRLTEDTLKKFKTDVGNVFESISCSDDEELFKTLINNNEYYQNIPEDAYELISAYTNISNQVDKESLRNEDGGYNMCKAFDDHYESGRKEGVSQGKEIILLAQIKDGEITIESAAKRLDMTPEEFMKKYHL